MAKNRHTTFTQGSMSDVSTTVMAPSKGVHKNMSISGHNNFAELGAGLINDTPRSKQSVDYRSAYRKLDRGSALFKPAKQNTTGHQSRSNLALNEKTGIARKNSMARSASRKQVRNNRGSTRNLLNPGGLTHFSFI